MTKLLKNIVIGGITEADVKAYGLQLKVLRGSIPPTPIIDDEESKSWEILGPVKRAEATETMTVLTEHEAALPTYLSLQIARNGFSVYDNADALIAFHQAEIENLKQLKKIGGATGLNMIKCCEEYVYQQAEHRVEVAIPAKNAIEKLARHSDKKPAPKKVKAEKTSLPPSTT